MLDTRTNIVRYISRLELPKEGAKLLAGLYDDEAGCFSLQESLHWDYKAVFPSKIDEYFAGILRLVCAFHNTYGGLIIFGVDDKSRRPISQSYNVNIENFNHILREKLTAKIECLHHKYAILIDENDLMEIDVLLIPKRQMGLSPVSFLNQIGKYKANMLWVRSGHEVLEAKSKNLPFLYSSRDDFGLESLDSSDFSVSSSLPPSPFTIKEFIGRRKVMDELWNWLVFDDRPRIFLHGPGGSGKSTLAYEFGKIVAESGRDVRISTGNPLDYVIYLSAKEIELNATEGEIQKFSYCDFRNATELFRKIILLSKWQVDESKVNSLSDVEIRQELRQLFDFFSGLIIIDNIDTLITKNIDNGMESLISLLQRAKHGQKILYTLRSSPTWAPSNAIAVPGLDFKDEYNDFLEVCCRQFKQKFPVTPSVFSHLYTATDGLPLLIEVVVGFRRTCGSYEEAVKLTKDQGGEQARRYLFEREYNFFPDNQPRYLLAVLSILNRPVTFNELIKVLTFSTESLNTSIRKAMEIFIRQSDNDDGTSSYEIYEVAKAFVAEYSKRLDKFENIKTRISYHRADLVPENPIVSRISLEVEYAISDNRLDDALAILKQAPTIPQVTEHPKYLALHGRVYSRKSPPNFVEARKYFERAFNSGKSGSKDLKMLRDWFFMELSSGFNSDLAHSVCDKVISGSFYHPNVKSEFYGKKAQVFRQQARGCSAERDRSLTYFRRSVQSYLQGYCIAISEERSDASKMLVWLQSSFSEYIQAVARFEYVRELADLLKEEIKSEGRFFDPLSPQFIIFIKAYTETTARIDVSRRQDFFASIIGYFTGKNPLKFQNSNKRNEIGTMIENFINQRN
jgi:hypothetical protein